MPNYAQLCTVLHALCWKEINTIILEKANSMAKAQRNPNDCFTCTFTVLLFWKYYLGVNPGTGTAFDTSKKKPLSGTESTAS